MKKILILALAVIFAFSFINCGEEGDDDNGGQQGEEEGGNQGGEQGNGNQDSGTYSIGDIGPGQGIIFFAQGGQYKECSGELGNNTWEEAVTAAENFRGGGFSDWSLPDRSELDLMYRHLKQQGKGGFQNGWYWSNVTDTSWTSYAWARNFQFGTENTHPKTSNSFGVRAVRSFTGGTGNEEQGNTTLTIKNESGVEIVNVRWNNTDFTTGTESIETGTSVTKGVNPGQGYLYFTQKGSPIPVRMIDILIVAEDEKKEIILTNNTLIQEINTAGTREALGTFFTKPWIILKQGDTEVALYEEYDLGGVLVDTYLDVVFTIQNIGGSNLTLDSVSANRVTLDENTSGFFNVHQQPLASTVQPGNSTSFTIRFSPTTISTNNSASVIINTNAKNTEEFAFRVKGNGRNYIIGDTGPGGGIVFYASGGQFLECSEELGLTVWSGASTLAESYSGGSYSDWSLPTRSELDLMYQNLRKDNIGGFMNAIYWSSTQELVTSFNPSILASYVQNFSSSGYLTYYTFESGSYYSSSLSGGNQGLAAQDNTLNNFRVRAVRSFSR